MTETSIKRIVVHESEICVLEANIRVRRWIVIECYRIEGRIANRVRFIAGWVARSVKIDISKCLKRRPLSTIVERIVPNCRKLGQSRKIDMSKVGVALRVGIERVTRCDIIECIVPNCDEVS